MNPALENLITSSKSENDEWNERIKRQEEESNNLRSYFLASIRPNLRSANPKDYTDWLKGFIDNGGKPTHYYNYDMPRDFYVPKMGLVIPSGHCGSLSFQVIVPIGMTVTHKGFNHCNIYLMDGFEAVDSWIPVYKNTIF
jgi:hypothetical protein